MDNSTRNDVDWRVLCEQASKEEDPERLIELVQRLNEALEERQRRRIEKQFYNAPDVVPGLCGERAVAGF
ncbi:MAG: hypothetical protein DMG77_08930 [Acidobacteria bacterium]|jgi:hypothetical protein|nr:MAG: hypothetical protein DMG77_08930 [Acidobacteriota bacterium]